MSELLKLAKEALKRQQGISEAPKTGALILARKSTEEVIVEPAAANPKPIYWEAVDGRILGPALPECLARVGDEFWIVTTLDGHLIWLRSDRLRSRAAFEQQLVIHEVELIPKSV